MPTRTSTRRKTTKGTGRRASRYTPEQIEQFKAADAALTARADDALADPAGRMVTAVITRTLAGGLSARILGYSLRNQALLMTQAEDLGIELSDVDTGKGWRARGRAVVDRRPMRIVRPKGRDARPEDQAADAEPVEQDGDGDQAGPVRFRMMTVYDVSQTEGPDDVDPAEVMPILESPDGPCPQCGDAECDPHDFACNPLPLTPAESLAQSLRVQLTRAGWTFTHEPDAQASADHDTRVIHMGNDTSAQALRLLADTVASLNTANTKQ
ncbi:hypothetical protein AB0M47_20905 [Hamadaea sp. NPDC051192]|uniref:hypothetical protein n=1 Tax=Hamadaea sp. NPDC051192 TaxID=3154940 RepID=UPI003426508B